MATKSHFIDDMRPRNFPTESRNRLAPSKVPVPKPVLSGVSMIADKNDKNQVNKALAKKSFTKWKQQHDALFERKHAETKNQTMEFLNQRKGTYAFDSSADASAKFDLDFKKLVPSQIETTEEYQHGCNNGIVNNFSATNLKRPQFQGMMAFSQLNRKLRSEATGFTVSPLAELHDRSPTEESQSNSCSCRCIDVASRPDPKTDFEGRGSQSSLQIAEDLSMDKLVQSKRQPTNKLLANIVEEQIEIVEQQKQILKQQNEIFNLQYQIEKALLLNGSSGGGLTNALPHKQIRRIAAAASSNVESNALSPIGNGTAFENCPDRSPNGRNSIGVMTSLSEICLPLTENGSPKDTMLERINKIIENSPPMISYKQTNGKKNCRISPLRSDVNISSKTLIYRASTRNNVSINEPKIADRSFALHLLNLKYHPEGPPPMMAMKPENQLMSPQQNIVEKGKFSPSKSTDFMPSNISPDKYDYLIRHGLLRK